MGGALSSVTTRLSSVVQSDNGKCGVGQEMGRRVLGDCMESTKGKGGGLCIATD